MEQQKDPIDEPVKATEAVPVEGHVIRAALQGRVEDGMAASQPRNIRPQSETSKVEMEVRTAEAEPQNRTSEGGRSSGIMDEDEAVATEIASQPGQDENPTDKPEPGYPRGIPDTDRAEESPQRETSRGETTPPGPQSDQQDPTEAHSPFSGDVSVTSDQAAVIYTRNEETQNRQDLQKPTEATRLLPETRDGNSSSEARWETDLTSHLIPEDKKGREGRGTGADSRPHKIFVVGKSGSGRSALCNKILGRQEFQTGHGFQAVTTHTREAATNISAVDVIVVDTPDISEKSRAEQRQIVDGWKKMADGFRYMIVLTVRCDSRYSPSEYQIYRDLKELWGDQLCSNLVVAFTFGDARGNAAENMESELKHVWPELKAVMADAGHRHVIFNNEDGNTDAAPVHGLMALFPRLGPGRRSLLSRWRALAAPLKVALLATGIVGIVAFAYLIKTIVSVLH